MKQRSQSATPFSLGFRMPAEWEPHEATWLGWPHEVTDWPGKFTTIPWAFAEIVRHLSQVERVYLLVEDRAAEARVRSMLKKSGANLDSAEVFREYFGVTNVFWLKNGIAGDDTHGHVDDLARFVNPSTVVTIVEDDPKDANYAALQENLALLKAMKDQDGRALRVETLPMPAPVYFEDFRLPASYANFY